MIGNKYSFLQISLRMFRIHPKADISKYHSNNYILNYFGMVWPLVNEKPIKLL